MSAGNGRKFIDYLQSKELKRLIQYYKDGTAKCRKILKQLKEVGQSTQRSN